MLTQIILGKATKKRIELHFDLTIKVISWSVRRRSNAEKLTDKPSVWVFADTVFKGLGSGDVKILNNAMEKKTLHR